MENIERMSEIKQVNDFEETLKELKSLVLENADEENIESLYDWIIQRAKRSLNLGEFSGIKVLKDINKIRMKNPNHAEIIQLFVVYNTYTYEDIANLLGVKRQRIYAIVQQYSKEIEWLSRLKEIKGSERTAPGTYMTGKGRIKSKGTVGRGAGRLVEGIPTKKHQFLQFFGESDF